MFKKRPLKYLFSFGDRFSLLQCGVFSQFFQIIGCTGHGDALIGLPEPSGVHLFHPEMTDQASDDRLYGGLPKLHH